MNPNVPPGDPTRGPFASAAISSANSSERAAPSTGGSSFVVIGVDAPLQSAVASSTSDVLSNVSEGGVEEAPRGPELASREPQRQRSEGSASPTLSSRAPDAAQPAITHPQHEHTEHAGGRIATERQHIAERCRRFEGPTIDSSGSSEGHNASH